MIDKISVNPSRSFYYALMGRFFIFTAEDNRYEGVKEALELLSKNGLDENSENAAKRLLDAFENKGESAFIQEYDEVFHFPGSKIIRTTASFYDEGYESGKKQLEVKNFLGKTHIRRNEKVYKEQEDSVGFLMVFMRELIELIISGKNEYENIQHCLFEQTINPFIDTFVAELFEHDKSDLYKDVAILLSAFMDFERMYFGLSKPERITLKEVKPYEENISGAEKARRAANKAAKLANN